MKPGNFQVQISKHIFGSTGDYSVYYSSNLFTMSTVLKIGEYSRIFPSFRWRIVSHVTCLYNCVPVKIFDGL